MNFNPGDKVRYASVQNKERGKPSKEGVVIAVTRQRVKIQKPDGGFGYYDKENVWKTEE